MDAHGIYRSATANGAPPYTLLDASKNGLCDCVQTPTGRVIRVYVNDDLTTYDLYCCYSDDNLATWSVPSTVASSLGYASTPALHISPDGQVWVYYVKDNAGTPSVYRRVSTNDGASWGAEVLCV